MTIGPLLRTAALKSSTVSNSLITWPHSGRSGRSGSLRLSVLLGNCRSSQRACLEQSLTAHPHRIRSQMLYPLSYRRRQPMLPRRGSAQERRRRASSWRSRTTTLASTSSDEPPGRRLAPPSAIRSRRSLSWCRPRVARVALRWIVVMMSSSFADCTHARQLGHTGAGVKGSEVGRPVPYGPGSG